MDDYIELYQGLKALSRESFPKTCATCGTTYETLDSFIQKTMPLRDISGLKSSIDEGDEPIVELYRNCSCGSTLLDFFSNRRDTTQIGIKRRQIFEKVLNKLDQMNIDRDTGRKELLKLMKGEKSSLFEKLGIKSSVIE